MSNLPKSKECPSNDEIIEEITKDLAEQLSVSNSEGQCLEQEGEATVPEDFDDSDKEESLNTLPDDFIDEEKLKDMEVGLSDVELAEQHSKSFDLKKQGNEKFKHQNYLESICLYTEGLNTCPLKFADDRAVLYSNRAASKAKLGRKQSAIEDCTKAIELNENYVKAYLRRAKLYEETDKLDESLADFSKLLELDPGNKDAIAAKVKLPPMIEERNEKLKTEMLGKLKELGNVILKPFGLSTENFQLNQDSNTGGYSVNFSQNPK